MKRILFVPTFLILAFSLQMNAQNPSEYLPDKPGKWSFRCNKTGQAPTELEFCKNQASVAEWFHQNVPMLNKPVGFDLSAVSYGIWNDDYKRDAANYGMRSEIEFAFQLFLADLSRGGKWVVEPPSYSFYINNTEAGHGTNPNYKYYSDSEYDPAGVKNFSPAQEKAINDAVVKLNGIFPVFPFSEEIAPGVDLYKESVDGHFFHIIVFNPERPPYWLPVTVKELADIYLEFYTRTEDEFMLPYLKKEIAEFSDEELNAPAYSGHETHVVLDANGKNEGLQLMRFNPDYWDKSLPPSAIQLMTFWYPQRTDAQMEEYYENNGHPHYGQILTNSLKPEELAGLIMKRP